MVLRSGWLPSFLKIPPPGRETDGADELLVGDLDTENLRVDTAAMRSEDRVSVGVGTSESTIAIGTRLRRREPAGTAGGREAKISSGAL